MKCLSIIIPVYNEVNSIREIIKRVMGVSLIKDFLKEIIIVDDGSTDGTRRLLDVLDPVKFKIIMHETNQGKGTAIRTGLKYVTGDYVIIQDADLEYDPMDYNILLKEMTDRNLSVVYGSRELKRQEKRYSGLHFYLGGIFLSKLTNFLYGQSLTDEATCYKLFRSDLIKGLPLHCKRFEFCPEVTALIAKRGIKISEVGISYFPRHKREGKKINWHDGIEAVWTLIKHRLK